MNANPKNPMPEPARNPDLAEEPGGGEDADFHDKVRTVMPWVASFGAHLGVLLLALLLVGAAVARPKIEVFPPPEVSGQEPPSGDRPFALPNPPGMEGTKGWESESAPEMITQTAIPQPPIPQGVGARQVVQSAAASPVNRMVARQSGAKGHSIFQMGQGENGTGPGGGGNDGLRQPPTRIVFLVDASGSLVDTLPFVIEDLKRLVGNQLNPECAFNIVFFSGKSVNADMGGGSGLASLFGDSLHAATLPNINKATEWMQKIEAGGSGDPLAAIKRAVAMDPQQIHLLSDNITGSGPFEMHQERFMSEVKKVLAAAAKKNGHAIRMKTYQFVYADPLTGIGMKPTLLRMAEETGGRPADYKFITARNLGLR